MGTKNEHLKVYRRALLSMNFKLVAANTRWFTV